MSYAPPAYTDDPASKAPAAAAPSVPKSYQATADASDAAGPSSPSAAAAAPLLGGQRAAVGGMPFSAEDEEDDMKYGTSVSTSAPEIRIAFIRKVYAILAAQLLFTAACSGVMVQPAVIAWTQANQWFFWLPVVGSFASLFTLMWKAHSYPLNLVVLAVFTLFEGITVGTVVSFYESRIVIQALLITLGVFGGLTLFAFQTKYNFDGLAPWLFGGLMVLFTTSMVGIFLPFSQGMDLVLALGGCLIFSGYILFDTQQIMKKLSPDEYIMGALRLYLDAINLFLQILRVLSNSNRD